MWRSTSTESYFAINSAFDIVCRSVEQAIAIEALQRQIYISSVDSHKRHVRTQQSMITLRDR